MARFETIIDIIVNMCSDQYYAYKISLTVISSKMDSDLAQLKVDSMLRSRW